MIDWLCRTLELEARPQDLGKFRAQKEEKEEALRRQAEEEQRRRAQSQDYDTDDEAPPRPQIIIPGFPFQLPPGFGE